MVPTMPPKAYRWVGEMEGNVRPRKLTSSLELPRAPTATGSD